MKETIEDIVADIRNKLQPIDTILFIAEDNQDKRLVELGNKSIAHILKRLKDIEEYKEVKLDDSICMTVNEGHEEAFSVPVQDCSNCGQCEELCGTCETFEQWIQIEEE